MKLEKLSRKATAAAIGGALALTGVGVGSAAVLSSPDTQPVSEQTEVTPSEDAAPSEEAAPTTEATEAAQPVEQPAPVPQPATVEDVTEPAQKPPAAVPAPQPSGKTIPAPQVNPDGSLPEGWEAPKNPGEPPRAPYTPPVAPKLPGEPGYEPPTG